MPAMSAESMQGAVLVWYRGARPRSLPLRNTRDPYAILVSEVMLQQSPTGSKDAA